ncbi:AAA family ATPase, partial [Vibrio sp. 10N.237.312.C02]|uniref:AAA family ATPase n=11 Tax=Vibrio TaxID=662 RepID=UPI00352DE70A
RSCLVNKRMMTTTLKNAGALKLGRYIVNKESYTDSFSFEFNNGDEAYNTSCFFDFDSRIPIKSRINVIIGENGTGKTTYLADLALSLSGRKNKGVFTEHRPSFSKVISASFSAFDTFEIPAEKKTFSYKYCGLRNKDGFMNRKNMLSVYKSCCKKISERHAIDLWLDTLNNFIPDDKLNYIKEEFFDRKIFSNIIDNKLLSSGESILLYSFTQIIAETKKESSLLFDEPELHLHPRAISHLIPAIKHILIDLNAYAIIATHSPIVLQQVPSKFIRVFDNNSGKVNSRVLEIETLGDSLSSITNEVFNTFEINQPYKELLKNLFRNNSIEEINDLFEGKLSLSCELYLESLRNNEK